MSTADQNIEDIFEQALALDDDAERQAYLEVACRENAELRRRVEALLNAHRKAGAFLSVPQTGATTVVAGDPMPGGRQTRTQEARLPLARLVEGPGTVIGRYKLLQEIGEGGFGVVYMAEQLRPVKRKVALKIIKLGMDTKQIIARFDAERQALAMMDHPHIAKVLDGDSTETGRPYFVMELVKGIPITDYCDQSNLSTQERLQLFIPVCSAVQHAHQKGIVHRDIKPSNVLVTLHDGQPVPKVIDFGVAKAMDQSLTEQTLFTEFRQFVGTPVYMSPEQAEMSGLDVDTRTDIYSLGVLLYELLTGTTPFDVQTLCRAGYDEIQRIIREEEPPKPSTRVSTLGEALGDIARHRKAQPATLSKLIRGDLDCIVMKALEKDRTRRYETANALAQDLQRHLGSETILAKSPSMPYRLRKFVRRNRVWVACAALIAAVLVIASVVSTSLALRARNAEALAQQRLSEARREAAKSGATLDFIQNIFTSPSPEEHGRQVRVLDLLDEATRHLSQGQVPEPEVEAAIRIAIGATYLNLREAERAEPHVRRAHEIRTRLLDERHHDVAESVFYMGRLHERRAQLDQAAQAYQRCLHILQDNLDSAHPLVALTLHNLGVVYMEQGKPQEAESHLRRALELSRQRSGPRDPRLATHMTLLGEVLRQRAPDQDHARGSGAALEESEALHREALSIYRAIYGDQHVVTARALTNLATLLRDTERLEEAEAHSREALAIRRAHYGNNDTTVAKSLQTLASIVQQRQAYEQAAALLEEALRIYQLNKGPSHTHVGRILSQLAMLLVYQQEYAAAAERCAEAIDSFVSSQGVDYFELAAVRALRGVCLKQLQRYEDAARELLEAHRVSILSGNANYARSAARMLAELYEEWGRDQEAARWRARSGTPATTEQD